MTHSREIKSFDFELVDSVVKNIHFRSRLYEFAKESNRIEGITNAEENEKMFNKLDEFLKLENLTVENVCEFNEWGNQREKVDIFNCDDFFVLDALKDGCRVANLLSIFVDKKGNPYLIYKSFHQLKPFTSGNGRTARAIWLWQMCKQHDYDLSRGFLHEFYYQSLSNG